MRIFSLCAFIFLAGSLVVVSLTKKGTTGQDTHGSHVRELGTVHWMRGFTHAQEIASKHHKPLLVLFQEVPGCSTCIGYGDQVLSHPLIVDAIESYFIPVAVYNNIPGNDRTTLKRFGEPSWNNPVVRIVRPDGTPLAHRLDGDYTQSGLINAIVTALSNDKEDVPEYVRLLQEEFSPQHEQIDRTTIITSCFWAGEVAYASIDGILSTRPGYINGEEAVEIQYTPSRVSYGTLVKKAQQQYCTRKIAARNERQYAEAKNINGVQVVMTSDRLRPDTDNKYYLRHSDLRFLPMTEIQQLKTNAAVYSNIDPLQYLSPSQIRLYRYIQHHSGIHWKNRIGTKNFEKAWNETMSMIG